MASEDIIVLCALFIIALSITIICFACDTCGRYKAGIREGLRQSKFTQEELAFARRYSLSYESARRVIPHIKPLAKLSWTDVKLIAKWVDDAEEKKRIGETLLKTPELIPAVAKSVSVSIVT